MENQLMPDKKTSKCSTLAGYRPFVQGFFLLFFVYLFVRVSFSFTDNWTSNLFFNLDPLVVLGLTLTGSTIKSAFLISIVLIVLTAVFGRFFCGWVCPMGTIFDMAAKVIPRRKNLPEFGNGPYKNIKYYILIFFLFGSIAGFSALLFFDPLVFLLRVFTLNVFPVVIIIANTFLDLIRPFAMNRGWLELSMISYNQPVFRFGFLSLAMFIFVLGLLYIERRFWCRNLCPLGALLSVFSRFSPFRRSVSDACNSCSKCARICPMNAISEDYESTSLRECIQCERCKPECPQEAISFSFNTAGKSHEFNPSRRGIILSGAGGLITALTAGSAVATKTISDTRLRPPGAIEEKDFLDACLRCGGCMKACPTKGLQPAGFQAGFEGLFTPVLTPRVGACEEKCNLCGQVCPTGAIRALPLIEKQYAVIGTAVIDRNRCIAWEQLKLCLICDEMCPYDAIDFLDITDEKGTLQRPFVLEDKCVGCGQCENKCPVKGPAAIYVTPIREVRQNTGTYITEQMKKLREVKEEDIEEEERSEGDNSNLEIYYNLPDEK